MFTPSIVCESLEVFGNKAFALSSPVSSEQRASYGLSVNSSWGLIEKQNLELPVDQINGSVKVHIQVRQPKAGKKKTLSPKARML